METKKTELKNSQDSSFKLVGIKGNKYFVKFQNLDIPISMNEAFYKWLLKNND